MSYSHISTLSRGFNALRKRIFVSIILLLSTFGSSYAASAIIEGLTGMRQGKSFGFNEVYYDIVQYQIFDDGRPYQLIQNVRGLYFNDGGTYGSALERQVYEAKIDWLNWANGKWHIPVNSRPSWLPIGSTKFWPHGSLYSGILYYEVLEGTGGGDPIATLIDRKLLRDVVKFVITNSSKPLNEWTWFNLRRLTGNQIRSMFQELGKEVADVAQNPELADLFTQYGDQMATLAEQRLAMFEDKTPASFYGAAQILRGKLSEKRAVSVEIARIYSEMFNSTVRNGMRSQMNSFSRDYEITLRRAEGNWTGRSPSWRKWENGRPIFNDLRSRNGALLEYDDTSYPWVYVPALGTRLFFHDGRHYGVVSWDDRGLPKLDLDMIDALGIAQSENGHVFFWEGTGQWYLIKTRNSRGRKIPIQYYIFDGLNFTDQLPAVNWRRVSNPF